MFKKSSRIKKFGFIFRIRPLTPADFLDDEVYPMCALMAPAESNKTSQKKISDKDREKEEAKKIKLIESVLKKGIISIRKKFSLKKIHFADAKLDPEQIAEILSEIITLSIGKNISYLNRQMATSLYRACKIYGILPSEFIKLSPEDYNLNILVTNIGLEDDYRNNIISALKAYGHEVYGDIELSTLERMLDNAKNNAGRR